MQNQLPLEIYKENLLTILKVSEQILQGVSYMVYSKDYSFVNLVINRKKGLVSKFELKVLKNRGTLDGNDVNKMIEFCYDLSDLYVLDFDVVYRIKDSIPTITIKLSMGVRKNTDQLNIDQVNRIVEVADDFKSSMQRVVDNNEIESISIEYDGEKTVVASKE